jgi:hypothetical protein
MSLTRVDVIEFDINVGNCLTNTFPDFALEGYSYESLVLSATPLLWSEHVADLELSIAWHHCRAIAVFRMALMSTMRIGCFWFCH